MKELPMESSTRFLATHFLKNAVKLRFYMSLHFNGSGAYSGETMNYRQIFSGSPGI